MGRSMGSQPQKHNILKICFFLVRLVELFALIILVKKISPIGHFLPIL